MRPYTSPVDSTLFLPTTPHFSYPRLLCKKNQEKLTRRNPEWKIKLNKRKCLSKHRRNRKKKSYKTSTAKRKGARQGTVG
ncbi:hypothetical protein I79_008726 [Cricetulus griseus]|uniref:Uncharacterized protein n=1 Tax=Cricetulus griseus TaxID=10029 RepID=G3HDW0_CRIGR|nr:hypothetical protein I79_008726 [Cricetulus griseus]